MLLRRITKHVTEQNWFAVFIDFIIVVVGVFIGIQVANWNEARVEAEREQEVLIAILDDLKLDLTMLESASAMAKINIDTSNYMLEQAGFIPLDKISIPVVNSSLIGQELLLSPHELIPEDRKNQLWKLVSVHFYPIQSNTAFSSLIAAGDLKIISNQDLISNLQSYTQHWNSLRDSNVTTYKKFRDRTIFVGQEFGLSPFIKIPEKDLIGMIQDNPKLKAVLRTLLEYTVLHKAQFEQTSNQTLKLIDKVEKEIR
ncbi:DUF6090 family protein [Marinicella sp. S1101]|uniref:DUF6090 family protein n=1 Tax=Marinicella marina TaxID=2996016 RepID=UPI00226101D9|nr:DUF6090 family protein [Marinicella marina]MCX7554748.1 DUF6090 family protein [Marinicella marina]MDJ1141436.1 DUF6090 family protein [Marinicella marina]